MILGSVLQRLSQPLHLHRHSWFFGKLEQGMDLRV